MKSCWQCDVAEFKLVLEKIKSIPEESEKFYVQWRVDGCGVIPGKIKTISSLSFNENVLEKYCKYLCVSKCVEKLKEFE